VLIPSIDLMGGKVVQLVQGEKLAVESTDIDGWVGRFARFPRVQLIDLDAAMRKGENNKLVRAICVRLPCRVGGGIRTIERARAVLGDGATAVIVGSALFDSRGPDLKAAAAFSEAIGADRLIAAIDSRNGQVVVRGWTESIPMTAADAARALEPYCGEFLYTHVDTEGLLGGIDMAAVERVRRSTSRRISAAGGISTKHEIARLDALGIDSVVGMAIYTGRLGLESETLG
jgi:phosphoribosylformimino-5-aminoimidazole carboxamide ribotide isomerase